MEIGTEELNHRQTAYKNAVDAWKVAIQHEENLASVEHSLADVDAWEQAGCDEEHLRNHVRHAKKFYEDGIRSKYFGFHGA